MRTILPFKRFKSTITNPAIFKSAIVLCTFLTIFNTSALADKPDPWTGPIVNTPGTDNNNPNAHPPHGHAPIDSGVVVLIAACIGYGIIRASRNRKLAS